MSASNNPTPSNGQTSSGAKPDFEKMSSHELEQYLKATVEKIRRTMNLPKGHSARLEIIQNRSFWGVRIIDFQTSQFVDIILTEIPPSVCLQHHERLRLEAQRLKKAWLLLVGLFGRELFKCNEVDLFVPDFLGFDNQQLKNRIKELREEVKFAGKKAFPNWKPRDADRVVSWLAERFDEWKSPIHCIGRIYEVERAVGSLLHRRFMDCPPYAQVVLQGFHGAGIRHPEYHLATDLALLFNLFLDAEELITSKKAIGLSQMSEHSQSLGRSVILACFNLLEAFITGLAAAHLHAHPEMPAEAAQKLRGLSSKGKYVDLRLEQKYAEFLPLITGHPWLDGDKPPFSELFGRCKLQRNALAHPSMPVHSEDDRRVQNEFHFHDITLQGVSEVVDFTLDAVCRVWKLVHAKPKPSWLRLRQKDGRFPHVSASLQPCAT
jgi:hypothetical protein